MPIVPNFSITPTASAGVYAIQDTSTGSDVAVVNFRVALNLVSGTNLSTSTTPFSAGVTINTNLAKDYALNVVVSYLNSSGVELYSTSQIYAFTQYGEQYFYSLIQTISTSPPQYVLQDNIFFTNFQKLRALLDAAPLAISVGQDVAGAQGCVLLYQLMLTNPTQYF